MAWTTLTTPHDILYPAPVRGVVVHCVCSAGRVWQGQGPSEARVFRVLGLEFGRVALRGAVLSSGSWMTSAVLFMVGAWCVIIHIVIVPH